MPLEPSPVEPPVVATSRYVSYGDDHTDSRGRRRSEIGLQHEPPRDDEVWHPEESGLAPRPDDDAETAQAKLDFLRSKHERQRLEASQRGVRPLPPPQAVLADGDRERLDYFGGSSNGA